MEKSSCNFLNNHPKVKQSITRLESHPFHEIAKKQMSGFGGMVSFDFTSEKKKMP
jgi:cystathionine beta-lyase